MVTSKDYTQDIQRDISIILINDERDANKILDMILSDKGCAIGLDIEAAVEMSRFGILCLLQLAYKNTAYIFDMISMNYKELKLKELFADKDIIKIFHDCLEDLSLLYNLYSILEVTSIFDTQIAHRLCYEDIYSSSVDTKHSSISLADLVREYLQIESDGKTEMHVLMSKDPYLWKKRPINGKMLEYAANDVAHLPKIFFFMKENCIKGFYKNLTFNTIIEECNKYLSYSKINLTIKNYNKIQIQKDREIQGLLKLDSEKKRYILDLSLNQDCYSTGYYTLRESNNLQTKEDIEQDQHVLISAEDNDKANSVSHKRNCLNVNENSFYPQSFLKRPVNGFAPDKSHPGSCFKKDGCVTQIKVFNSDQIFSTDIKMDSHSSLKDKSKIERSIYEIWK